MPKMPKAPPVGSDQQQSGKDYLAVSKGVKKTINQNNIKPGIYWWWPWHQHFREKGLATSGKRSQHQKRKKTDGFIAKNAKKTSSWW